MLWFAHLHNKQEDLGSDEQQVLDSLCLFGVVLHPLTTEQVIGATLESSSVTSMHNRITKYMHSPLL